MGNWEREYAAARAAKSDPYAPAVLAGPWWLGYNDACARRAYWNDYRLRTDRYEYQQGYLAGARVHGLLAAIIDTAHAAARP